MSSLTVNGITALGWTLCGVPILLTAIRYLLRTFVRHNWYYDDLAHGLAVLIFIGFMATYTSGRSIANSVADQNDRTPDKFRVYLQYNVAVTNLGWSSFWAIKVAFLLFYRMLFNGKRWFERTWWCVLAFVVVAYWVVVASTLVWCGGRAAFVLDQVQCTSADSMALDRKFFIVGYCMNVSSDLAVMALPLSYLSTVQVSRPRKIGLGILFCLGFVIIAFDSLRLSQSVGTTTGADNVLWTILETFVCIFVSCCPTFMALKRWKENGFRASRRYGYPLNDAPVHTAVADETEIGIMGERGVEDNAERFDKNKTGEA